MDFSISNLPNLLLLLPWTLLWFLGGWWLVRGAFVLQRREEGLVGFAVGLVLQTWLANLLPRWMPVPLAFWVSAAIVFLAGLISGVFRGWRSLFQLPILPAQWLALLFLTYLFLGIERGLAIFDDYAHLPTTSLLAAGFIPPQFALEPSFSYGYHYFLMLFAAEVARIGNFFVWTALDISRALSIALSILLTALWVQRITRSFLASFFSACFTAFAMGTRWLFLFLPVSILSSISQQIHMLGSAAQSAPDFLTALTSVWQVEGSGPFPFPFAYANGIITPEVMNHGPNGSIGAALAIPILLSFNRWRNNWQAFAVSLVLMGAGSLLGETGLVFGFASWGIMTLVYLIQHRTWRIPFSIGKWWLLLIGSSIISILQGGAWTDLFSNFINRIFFGAPPAESYQTIGFALVWPITVVSSHLGILELTNPWQLLAAILEIGPVLLAAPLVIWWAVKSYRSQRWYEAAAILGGYLTIATFFVQFTGSAGVRNTSRLYGFVSVTAFFCVPILYLWVKRRSDLVRSLVLGWAFILFFGGMMLFGIELIASQRPVASTFISSLDSVMYRRYWNRLDKDTLIFDPNPFRVVTTFGRYTNSSTRWLVEKPEWKQLYDHPDPYDIRKAGFDYVYLDHIYWEELSIREKSAFSDACVFLVEEVRSEGGEKFRRLYDIRACSR